VARLQRDLKGALFSGWTYHRTYSKAELREARLFQLKIAKAFEPAGEHCGTVYDRSGECLYCGAGLKQVSNLRLDLKRATKTKDWARTFAAERIASQRLAEVIVSHTITGCELSPVDEDPKGQYRCPLGHTKGLNILSELTVRPVSWEPTDFSVTDGCVGWRLGVWLPAPLIVISQRFRQVLEQEKIKGHLLEVAHAVE
jgi:hypothetical protein